MPLRKEELEAMQSWGVYPVYRKLKGASTWYRIEGPARWVEVHRIGNKWMRHELVAMQYPEKMLVQDLLNDRNRFEEMAPEVWHSEVVEGGSGTLPGRGVDKPINVLEWHELGAMTTFGVPGRTAYFVEVESDDAVRAALRWKPKSMPLLVLGGGSNMLLHSDWPGLVLHVNVRGSSVLSDDGRYVEIVSGAGENWHDFVMETVKAGWRGLENLALIPGKVGAAPMQNIGAYGVEIKDRCVWVEAISINDGSLRRFQAAECAFGYRESIFKQAERGNWVITRVAFRLDRAAELKTEYGAIKEELASVPAAEWQAWDVAEAVIRIRTSKLPDPAVLGNAGSFFKNPVLSAEAFAAFDQKYPEAPRYPQADGTVKLAAGWLIERAGWKGHDRGTHAVHDRQALVLVNKGGATGAQIWELAQNIRQDVLDQFHVELEPEVNQIGLEEA